MKRYDILDDIFAHVWSYVEAAVHERNNAMTTPVFATHGPAARTVALRAFDPQKRSLIFHTDARSAKVNQIGENPRASWVGWDERLSQQFQLIGTTTVHTNDEFAERLWESEPEENLDFYYKTLAPGSGIDGPVKCVDRDAVSSERARENFAAVRTVVDEIVWLHLHPEIEYRARFRWDGEAFRGEWIVP